MLYVFKYITYFKLFYHSLAYIHIHTFIYIYYKHIIKNVRLNTCDLFQWIRSPENSRNIRFYCVHTCILKHTRLGQSSFFDNVNLVHSTHICPIEANIFLNFQGFLFVHSFNIFYFTKAYKLNHIVNIILTWTWSSLIHFGL